MRPRWARAPWSEAVRATGGSSWKRRNPVGGDGSTPGEPYMPTIHENTKRSASGSKEADALLRLSMEPAGSCDVQMSFVRSKVKTEFASRLPMATTRPRAESKSPMTRPAGPLVEISLHAGELASESAQVSESGVDPVKPPIRIMRS